MILYLILFFAIPLIGIIGSICLVGERTKDRSIHHIRIDPLRSIHPRNRWR